MDRPEFSILPRHFRNSADFARWSQIRTRGFTEWYAGPPRTRKDWLERHRLNAQARLFPDFYLQVRNAENELVAYLTTTPAYWCGESDALQDLHHYYHTLTLGRAKALAVTALSVVATDVLHLPWLFEAAMAKRRRGKVSGANAIMFVGMGVAPEYQKQRIPSLLLREAQKTARRLGYDYVVGPFRPNRYGRYKAERRATHSTPLFEEYVSAKDAAGLPRDPWLRVVARHGARFLKIEPRSFSVAGTIPAFESFRQRFRPDEWYSPATDVWECGETPTWYVDRCRKMVLAVEPNVWGVLPAGPAPEALPTSQSALPEAQMPLAGRATPLSAGLADLPGLDGFLPGASPSLTGRRIAS